ncbi:hypothetical protein EVAR_31460_1 [Eumeta japonica]|uniref:Uncharacterized protein n=1 Tax=Eumeta variegata TaxID=151549 RepID=A0A4C1WAL9_EUMVA|nr:hypothetical protein EVAR_31460_1 [Eumeta japonica]
MYASHFRSEAFERPLSRRAPELRLRCGRTKGCMLNGRRDQPETSAYRGSAAVEVLEIDVAKTRSGWLVARPSPDLDERN